jgi:hypothetical protein
MYARRHRRAPQSTTHKLQQGHLRRRILHSYPIRLEFEIRLATDISSIVRVRQQRLFGILEMRIQDLLGERQVS